MRYAMVKITESKLGSLAENAEKMLKYGGKVMQCIENLKRGDEDDDEEMGERRGGHYGSRYDGGYYGNRYGNREDYPDYDDMGERRGVPGTGRYGRY